MYSRAAQNFWGPMLQTPNWKLAQNMNVCQVSSQSEIVLPRPQCPKDVWPTYKADMAQYQIFVQYQYFQIFYFQNQYQNFMNNFFNIKININIKIFPPSISKSISKFFKTQNQYQNQYQYCQNIDIDI